MTYFEIVNMVAFYCEKQGIEIPERVSLPKVFENPSTGHPKEIKRETSLQNFHPVENSRDNFDVSRVKTVVYRSSDISQPAYMSASKIERSPQPTSTHQFSFAKPPTQVKSPKITFNIRASLPVQAAPPFSLKTIPREVTPSRSQPRIVIVAKSQMPSPQNQIVMQKVERKSSAESSNKEFKNL
jgi:hypothetical protein